MAKEPGAMHFDGMTFRPQGKALTVYLAIGQKDGSIKEETFGYTRVEPGGR